MGSLKHRSVDQFSIVSQDTMGRLGRGPQNATRPRFIRLTNAEGRVDGRDLGGMNAEFAAKAQAPRVQRRGSTA